jgi:hypothetical protein
MFEIKGKLQFDPVNISRKHEQQAAWKKVAMVRFGDSDETAKYYKWLLEQRFGLRIPDVEPFIWKGRLNDPVRGTHVTAINEIVDDEIYEKARMAFHGKEVRVQYDPTLIRCNRKGERMWWHIKAYSEDLDSIRAWMGLGRPYHSFHITVGLVNPKFIDHSEWVADMCDKHKIYQPIR